MQKFIPPRRSQSGKEEPRADPFAIDRGYAMLDTESWNASMQQLLLSTELRFINKEEALRKQESALESIVSRKEKYPTPRLPTGKFTSINKAGAALLEVRKQLLEVAGQRQDMRAKLQQLR
jgi:hypothetical protein